MEDGPDSGYPSPRDGIPQTSTPIRPGAKPSLNEHFSGFDTTLEFGNGSHAESSSTEIPKSKPSHTKADEGIRSAISAERDKVGKNKLERSRNEDHNRIQHLEFDLVGAKRSYTEAQNEIKQKEEQIVQLQQKVVGLESSLNQAESFISLNEQLQSKCKVLEDENKNMRSLANTYEKEIEKSKVSITETEKNNMKLNDETKRLLQENATFQQHLASMQKDIEYVREQYSGLEKTYNELKVDLKQKVEAHAIDSNRIEQLQSERDILEKEIDQLRETQANYRCRENGLREEVTSLREQKEKLVFKNAKLGEDNSTLQGRVDELQQNCAVLTEKLDISEADNRSYISKLHDRESESAEKEKLQKQLLEHQVKLVKLEKQLPQLVSENNKIKIEMSDIKQKNDELESVNEHYARKDIETSTETQMLQRNLSGKQREYQQLSEEISITKKKLEDANTKVKHLNELISKNSQSQKSCVDLEKLNLQLTNEIEYLRSKTREQPSLEEHRQVNAKFDHLTAELAIKEGQLKNAEEKCTELSHMLKASKNAQSELDKSSKIIKEHEAEITSLKRSNEVMRAELDEKSESNAKLIEEFERFKEIKDDEIKHYATKLSEAEENYVRLHAQLQREMEIRAISSAGCDSSVWESIPEEIRLQLSQNSEDILKSIKIGRTRAYSTDHDEFPNKLAEFLEQYSSEKLNATDAVFNIFKVTSRLLRLHTSKMESFVASFSSEVSQFLEQREKKYMVKIAELEQTKIEESKGRREYHMKAHDLEHDLDSAKNIITNLQNQLAALKTEFSAKTKIIETRDSLITTLKEQLEELTVIRIQLQEQASENEKVVQGFLQMVEEYKTESDQYQEEEQRLHEQIRSAERESELLKRQKTSLETDHHSLSLEHDTLKRKLKDTEQKVFCGAQELEECKKRLSHEERTKRFNQETMRKCFEYMDNYKETIEHLKQRNWQRQKVLDKIAGDLETLCSQKSLETYKKLINDKCPKWKKDDEEVNNRLEELCLDFNKMIRERSTSEVKAAFKETRQKNNPS